MLASNRGPEWRQADGSLGVESLAAGRGRGVPRPAPGKMQSEAARRAGEPPGQGKEPPPEGLVVTICSPGRAAPSSGRGYAPSPGRPARRRWRRSGPRGDLVQPDVFVLTGVLDLGVAAMMPPATVMKPLAPPHPPDDEPMGISGHGRPSCCHAQVVDKPLSRTGVARWPPRHPPHRFTRKLSAGQATASG